MSKSTPARRAVAELRVGAERPAWSAIGNRSLHQFWNLLSPCFRGVLLSPQRRPDGGGVSWTWREAGGNDPLTAAELADVRRRLKSADQSFTGKTVDSRPDDEGDSGAAAVGIQVRSKVQAMVAKLTSASDSALAGYVCRTESGPMVHSWGASMPAQPYYPDTIECEVSGALIMGTESAAGITLVFENRQGIIVARTQTNASGSFRFQKVAPGNYRIRVTDRGDFPTTGFALAVERESIVGLELRRGSSVATVAKPDSQGPLQPATLGDKPAPHSDSSWETARVDEPRRQRRRIAIGIFFLLAVVAGAGGSFLFRRPNDSAARDGASRTLWQTASGQGAPFEMTGPIASHRSNVPDVTSLTSPLASPPAKADRSDPIMPLSSGAAATKVDEADAADNVSDAGSNPSATRGRADSRASPSGSKNLRMVAASSSRNATAESANEIAPSESTENSNAAPDATTSASGGKSGRPPAALSRRVGSGSANRAPNPEDKQDDDLPESNSIASGVGGLPDTPAAKSTAKTPNAKNFAAANHANNALAQSTSTSAAQEIDDALVEAVPSPELNRLKSGQSAPRKVGRELAEMPSPPTTPDLSMPEKDSTSGDGLTDVEARAASTRPVRHGANPEATRVRAAGDEPDASSDLSELASAPPPSAKKSISSANARKPRATPSPVANEQPAALSEEAAPAPPALPPGGERSAGENLGHRLRVRMSAWERRHLRDLILPTRPMPLGKSDTLESLRKELIAEEETRLPSVFRHPVITSGFVLELDASDIEPGNLPRWRDTLGVEPDGASVRGKRAEIAWTATTSVHQAHYVLVRTDGRELARVEVEAAGNFVLMTSRGVRSSFWVGVGSERGSNSPTESRRQLDWQLLSGAPMPVGWQQDNRWLDGWGYRLELPVSDYLAGAVSHIIALVDPVSGWAIAGEVVQQR